MRVLMVGTLPAGMHRAEQQLVEAGHDVVRCHEPGERSFPCAGLVEDRGCPLEAGPVDVVVTARDRAWPHPSPFEDGAVCALRRHVPLVVLGTALHPFERWTPVGVDDESELDEACRRAAAAPLLRHSEVATNAAREIVELAQIDAEGTTATVHHRRGALAVELSLSEGAETLLSNVTARVVTALRTFDPYAAGIDVSLRPEAQLGTAR